MAPERPEYTSPPEYTPPASPSLPPTFPAPLDYPAPNDTRAVLALVLGLASLVTCGLTGIFAVVLGFASRSAIQRSGGLVRGEGIATAGIATGIAGTAFGMATFAVALGSILIAARAPSAHAAPPPLSSPSPPAIVAPAIAPPAAPTTLGSLRIVDLDPGEPFRDQLENEFKRAQASHETLVLMTDKRDCEPCNEIDASFVDARMQKALAHVTLVRVDIDAFSRELAKSHMLEETMPWFYKLEKLGAKLEPTDAISAGEWADNVPENMAPVLGKFVTGKLKTRHDDSQIGTPL